jgi:hypothetical protein
MVASLNCGSNRGSASEDTLSSILESLGLTIGLMLLCMELDKFRLVHAAIAKQLTSKFIIARVGYLRWTFGCVLKHEFQFVLSLVHDQIVVHCDKTV